MRLGYLGPEGTFSEEAVRADVDATAHELVPLATVHDVVMAVQRGDVDRALAPMENSLEGGVAVTLDTLAGEGEGVRIVGEVVRPVRHCLVAGAPAELATIDAVASHPQAHGQCRRFLREHLPHARILAATSTAEAVRAAAADPSGRLAALGTRAAAELYGGTVLRDGVEDEPGNATRFVWLGPPGDAVETDPADPGTWKTTVVFWGTGADAPGWLVRCLSEFAFRGVNLVRIESRPLRHGLGSYMFFVDLEGRDGDRPVAEAVAALGRQVEHVRVLGSYPAG